MLVKDFDYKLPRELIAQYPPKERGKSRLLVLHRKTQKIEHQRFHNIVEYLGQGDILILNETKVIPARLIGRRVGTGGKVEVFLLKGNSPFVPEAHPPLAERTLLPQKMGLKSCVWEVLISPGRAKKAGVKVEFGPNFWGEVCSAGVYPTHPIFEFHFDGGDFNTLLEQYGKIPLPPYIKRAPVPEDYERYQTIYANVPGACAAPTAGLHFTQDILDRLSEKGVEIVRLVLHTGFGSFKPIKSEKVEDYQMEPEYYEIPPTTVEKLKVAKRRVAVGTTTVRALESVGFPIQAGKGWADKFIYPPYEFKGVDVLITNFHLPKSTLLLLVCAFACKEFIFRAYREAIKHGYKFYSYGDAMLIL